MTGKETRQRRVSTHRNNDEGNLFFMLKKFRKIIIFLAIFLIASKLLITAGVFLYPKFIKPEPKTISSAKLIEMTNDYRLENGLNALSVNARLTQAAVNKAANLLTEQYFAHTSPEGKRFSQWIKDVNYKYFYVGENLAIDFSDEQSLFLAWLDSPTHKDNIIKPQYQEIGIAALEGKYKNHPTVVVVQLFGTRVLGANEQNADAGSPSNIDNYFYPETFWQKAVSLNTLNRADKINNYILFVLVGLAIISYSPQKRKSQINIKQPIISRYHAKTFRE